ncbi:glycosyltransferase family 2 protein [Anaerorhabdus furcosa]|uniref:Glycosyltransferase involved in cell wall bisynthesis n=1 Tax=Anaerorhabdus furcosa TaxID=118967 RepID=A0A1T4LWH7_9FIRM|nr:glycosyltransferase [Anaerorhabdus furcosa]SJZ59042.1 Glycosyltransferase involved in cell wall bisynthesis [Anaerorhabdus furcosa]
MTKVSIIVPIYNVEEYLGKCIESCLCQTFVDYELILVNDGSTDNGLSICREYEMKDSRIKVLDKPNGGLSDARNAGMKIATSPYIYFLDSDDFIEPTLIEKCVNKLDETSADMIIFDVYQYSMKTNTKEIIKNGYGDSRCVSVANNPEVLTKVLNAAWNKMYKLSLFKDNHIEYPLGYYYEDLGTTYKLMLKANQICFINEPLYDYLVDRTGNITQQFNKKIYDVIDMIDEMCSYYKKEGQFEKYKQELMCISGVNLLNSLKKTRDIADKEEADKFIDTCFSYIYKQFPKFPFCKYFIIHHKDDWIYANPRILKFYLAIRKCWH